MDRSQKQGVEGIQRKKACDSIYTKFYNSETNHGAGNHNSGCFWKGTGPGAGGGVNQKRELESFPG